MTKFKKGNIPHNKGKKLDDYVSPDKIENMKKTQFKEIDNPEDHPSWKGGVRVIKNDVVHLYAGKNKRVRRPKKVYEETHGPIPNGWVIYHLDGDHHNDDIDNLIAIPRAILIKICSGRVIAIRETLEEEVNNYINSELLKS